MILKKSKRVGFFLNFFITKLSTKYFTPITANGFGLDAGGAYEAETWE